MATGSGGPRLRVLSPNTRCLKSESRAAGRALLQNEHSAANWKAVENDCLTRRLILIRPCVPSHVAYVTIGWHWWAAMAGPLLVYFYAHYGFASITSQVSSVRSVLSCVARRRGAALSSHPFT